MDELFKQIDKLTSHINAGTNVDAGYEELKRLRKQAADLLMETARDGKYLRISPATLRRLHRNDFPPGTIISCRGYFIHVNGWKTYAETDVGRIVTEAQMPKYLHGFVF